MSSATTARRGKDVISRYLLRQAYPAPAGLPEPRPGLKLVIVIPALAERCSLSAVLDSLVAYPRRLDEAEVLVIVNNADNASDEIVRDNLGTLEDLARSQRPLAVYAPDYASPGRALPAAQAGVGLARRLGMDAALRRLRAAGSERRGAIACLDADSRVAPGYIDAVLAAFDRPQAPAAGLCSYAHPRPKDETLARAITAYEVWLRYIELGLVAADTPFAFSTIGSCMVVSAAGYALAGGMEPRKAAEDFHFLRKVAKISPGRLPKIAGALVFPEARASNRVPFGTGRAMQVCLAEGTGGYDEVEPPEAFLAVRDFLRGARAGFLDPDAWRAAVSGDLAAFLEQNRAWEAFAKYRRTYPGPIQFARAVHHWCDSLRILRFIRLYARAHGRVPVLAAATVLLASVGWRPPGWEVSPERTPISDEQRASLLFILRGLPWGTLSASLVNAGPGAVRPG